MEEEEKMPSQEASDKKNEEQPARPAVPPTPAP